VRVSSRGQYGVRALAYLAAHYGEGPINVRTVAEAEGLPAKYLEQLLARLRRGGLVRSSRGAHGGITLAREPRSITVRQVVLLLEGSLAPVECLQSANGHDEDCVPHELWRALHEEVLKVLDSFTLADLAARRRAREAREAGRRAAGAPAAGAAARAAEPAPEAVGAGSGSGRDDVHA
jgi:Rrf2 family transcriptional regulator, cysteine metabolism repressor